MKFESCKRQSSDLDRLFFFPVFFFFLFPVAMATWESSFRRVVLTDLSGEGTELGREYHNSLQNTQVNQTSD